MLKVLYVLHSLFVVILFVFFYQFYSDVMSDSFSLVWYGNEAHYIFVKMILLEYRSHGLNLSFVISSHVCFMQLKDSEGEGEVWVIWWERQGVRDLRFFPKLYPKWNINLGLKKKKKPWRGCLIGNWCGKKIIFHLGS